MNAKNARERMREFALTCTWEDVEKLIYSTAHKFIRQYGSPEFEDAVGVGYQVFMRITNPADVKYYNRGRGKFSNWLRFNFWNTLLEAKEKEARDHSRCPRDWSVDLSREVCPTPRPGRLMELLDQLSSDAQTVARLALDAPADVRMLLASEKDQIKAMRRAISEYLCLLDRGWTPARVEDCCEEIEVALGVRDPLDYAVRSAARALLAS